MVIVKKCLDIEQPGVTVSHYQVTFCCSFPYPNAADID